MSARKKIAFIINPNAGTDKVKNLQNDIHRNIDSSLYDIHIAFTSYAGEAAIMAKSFAEQNYFAVTAIGGDGTVNEVGSALIHSSTRLAIIPKGSGNGLARVLGIPLDTVKALKVINLGHTLTMDVGKANDQVFLNNCGVGFDAHIAHQIQQQKQRGFLMYAQLWEY